MRSSVGRAGTCAPPRNGHGDTRRSSANALTADVGAAFGRQPTLAAVRQAGDRRSPLLWVRVRFRLGMVRQWVYPARAVGDASPYGRAAISPFCFVGDGVLDVPMQQGWTQANPRNIGVRPTRLALADDIRPYRVRKLWSAVPPHPARRARNVPKRQISHHTGNVKTCRWTKSHRCGILIVSDR